MRIAVVGGGPGGLYFSYLWKRRHPAAHVELFEQNAADATWGFGVVFSEQALEFLREDDPDTVAAIAPRMQSWTNITLNLRGERIEIDGIGFSSIGRLALLRILQQRAEAVGVICRYETVVQTLDQLKGYDLIVAADGLNSFVRRSFEGDFGTSMSYASNKFAWYGTSKRFETLSQTFVETEQGSFTAHHYRYAARYEHLSGRVRPRHVAALWLCREIDRGVAQRSANAYSPMRSAASADLEQIGLAQFPMAVERALVVPQHGADRGRPAHRAFFDRLGHPACDRGCDCVDQGVGRDA